MEFEACGGYCRGCNRKIPDLLRELGRKRKRANGEVTPAGAAPVGAGGCEATGKPLVCEFVSQNLGTR